MPIYEYKCADCKTHFEKMRKVTDEPLKVCESCGGRLEKQMSLSGFQFKGEGWYVTDYSKTSSGGKETKSEKGEKSEKSEKSEKGDKSEKSSSSDSTATSDSASNKTKDTTASSKKD